jgi:hypothetical protein
LNFANSKKLAKHSFLVFKVIGCPKCKTIQYVKKDQKTRICTQCGHHIDCLKSPILSKANTEKEAQATVKSMKTPNDIILKLKQYQQKIDYTKSQRGDNYQILGDLITKLLEFFPNAIPESILFEQAVDSGLDNREFITQILNELQNVGNLIINLDFQNNRLLKFINVPFSYGKISIKKPVIPIRNHIDK